MVTEDTGNKAAPHAVNREPERKPQPEDVVIDATSLAEIHIREPLEVLDEALGSDPYNCTGRFTRVED